jgi:hypothetical protein
VTSGTFGKESLYWPRKAALPSQQQVMYITKPTTIRVVTENIRPVFWKTAGRAKNPEPINMLIVTHVPDSADTPSSLTIINWLLHPVDYYSCRGKKFKMPHPKVITLRTIFVIAP